MLAFHTNGITQYAAFCVWLLSLSIMFSQFIEIVACIHASFLFMAEYPLIFSVQLLSRVRL